MICGNRKWQASYILGSITDYIQNAGISANMVPEILKRSRRDQI